MISTAMIDTVYNGFAVPGGSLLLPLYVPEFLSADVPVTGRDVAKANQLLDDLGYAKGSDGIRDADGVEMQYTLLVGAMNRAIDSRIADMLTQNLAEVGIGVEQKLVDNQVPLIMTQPKPYTDFDMTLIMWGLMRARPGLVDAHLDQHHARRVQPHRLFEPGVRQAVGPADERDGRSRVHG